MSNCMRNVDTSPNLFNLTSMEFDTFGFRFGFGLAQILYISHITVLLYNLLIILFVFFYCLKCLTDRMTTPVKCIQALNAHYLYETLLCANWIADMFSWWIDKWKEKNIRTFCPLKLEYLNEKKRMVATIVTSDVWILFFGK